MRRICTGRGARPDRSVEPHQLALVHFVRLARLVAERAAEALALARDVVDPEIFMHLAVAHAQLDRVGVGAAGRRIEQLEKSVEARGLSRTRPPSRDRPAARSPSHGCASGCFVDIAAHASTLAKTGRRLMGALQDAFGKSAPWFCRARPQNCNCEAFSSWLTMAAHADPGGIMPNQWPRAVPSDPAAADACPPQSRIVDSLTAAERFMVWSLRQWVEGWRDGVPDSRSLREGFAVAYAPDGLAPFDAMMRAVVAGTRRQLDVRCLRCRFVSDDENLFINLVAAGQRDRDDLLASALEEFVAPAAARLATAGALALAGTLTAAGLLLPLNEIPGVAQAASLRAAGRGLRLVQ
jgi:hypothetical protein